MPHAQAQNRTAKIEEMLRTIIYPLQECDGIEALRAAVKHTAVELTSGSLRSLREVEVSLIANGTVSRVNTLNHSMAADEWYFKGILPVLTSL